MRYGFLVGGGRKHSRWLRDDDEDPKNYLTGVQRALAIARHDCPSNDGGVHPNFLPLAESNILTSIPEHIFNHADRSPTRLRRRQRPLSR
jgi:hypothetical protein